MFNEIQVSRSDLITKWKGPKSFYYNFTLDLSYYLGVISHKGLKSDSVDGYHKLTLSLSEIFDIIDLFNVMDIPCGYCHYEKSAINNHPKYNSREVDGYIEIPICSFCFIIIKEFYDYPRTQIVFEYMFDFDYWVLWFGIGDDIRTEEFSPLKRKLDKSVIEKIIHQEVICILD